MKINRRNSVVLLLGGLVLVGASGFALVLSAPGDPMLASFHAIELGMMKDQVVDLLGPPIGEVPCGLGDTSLIWEDAEVHACLVVFIDDQEKVSDKLYYPPEPCWQRIRERLESWVQ